MKLKTWVACLWNFSFNILGPWWTLGNWNCEKNEISNKEKATEYLHTYGYLFCAGEEDSIHLYISIDFIMLDKE